MGPFLWLCRRQGLASTAARLNPGAIVIKKSVAGFYRSKILTKLLMLKNLSYDTKAYFESKDL